MSLTSGRGPLGGRPRGRFNQSVPDGLVYVEPFPRRVRAVAGDTVVIDTERAVLVHRPGKPLTWAFPAADVEAVASEPDPDAEGYVRVPWEVADVWLEEDQPVRSHPRNPYHRIDILPTRRRLRVEAAGATLVDTSETVGLWETTLDPRLYVAKDRVRTDLLVPSTTTTYCPYKGVASYWSARVEGTEVADVAWSYETPYPESLPIAGMLAFDGARATVEQELPAGEPWKQ